jgi:hypothetical protein
MTDAMTVQMPQRWDFAGDYDDYLVPLEEGDYVKVEDVNPLVDEIERLRARVEVLERVLHGAVAESHNFVKRVIKEAKP